MKNAPAVVPEMEARHLAACQVERIASHILAGVVACDGYLAPAASGFRDAVEARALYALAQAEELVRLMKHRGYP